MASHAGYRRRSPSAHYSPPYLDLLSAPVVADDHMPERQLSRPRKRQRSESPKLRRTSQPVSKKQRLSHAVFEPPAAFWDGLSIVHLTKRALRELDRRNSLATKKRYQTTHYTDDYPRSYKAKVVKDIEQFAKRGGPDLSDLRNYPEPCHPSKYKMSSSQSSFQSRQQGSATTLSTKSTTNTPKTKSTGPYDRTFQQRLIDVNVYPEGYEYPDGSVPAEPNNLKEINEMLAQPRPSLSPSRFSNAEFREFKRADTNAPKEKQVSESVITIIEGKIADAKCRAGGIPFTNLVDLGNDDSLAYPKLTSGNPDIYYGARPEQLSRKVRDELSGQIIPSTQDDLPIAPNFFLAAKGPDGSAAVAKRQACYDGALGARGMHALQSYQQVTPVYDNNAATISSIYHNGQLQMYTSHVGPPRAAGGRPETYMTQLNTWGLTGNADTFRQGAAAYRNARDWAKEQRDTAISRANEWSNRAETEAPADASASPALSFVTAEETEETYTLTQESRTSLNEEHGPPSEDEESDSSIEEPTAYTLPAKRSTRSSSQQIQRKRHNADHTSSTGMNDARTSHNSAPAPPSWEWDTNYQKYRYWNGKEWVWQ